MVVTVVILYALAMMDAALSGYRASAGWNALVQKRAYHTRAVMRAVAWVQLPALLAVAAAFAFLASSSNPGALLQGFTHAANRALEVYVPYSVLVVMAFALWVVPSRDVRSLSIVLILGPFTLLRLPMALSGAIWAIWHEPRAEVIAFIALVLGMMFSLEPLLTRTHRRTNEATEAPRERQSRGPKS